ncbi:hypothetical protein OSH11_10365, partial [Kaistia dalseonensis]
GSAGIEGGAQPVLDLPALASETLAVTAAETISALDLTANGAFQSVFAALYADADMLIGAGNATGAGGAVTPLPANTLVVYRVPKGQKILARTI